MTSHYQKSYSCGPGLGLPKAEPETRAVRKGEDLKGKKQRKEKPKLVTTLRKQSLILPVPSGEAYRI